MFNRSVKYSQNVRLSTAGSWRDEGGGETEIAGNVKRENAVHLQKSAITRPPAAGKCYVTGVPSPELSKLRARAESLVNC